MNGKPKIYNLDNGLRCLNSHVESMKSVTVLCLVKAGTRYEVLNNNGISHFLEHMVFKGTEKYPTAMKISQSVDNVGGIANAYTAKEYTAFYVKAACEHFELALDMVSQLVFSPLIPEKEMEIEKGVILEEIRMYEDEPMARVAHLFEETMFGETTIGWNTLGKMENIKGMKRQDFTDYMSYLYAPNRMVLSIAGGIGSCQDLVNKYFGKKRDLINLETQKYEFEQKKAKVKKIKKDTEQCHLVYGFRTFGRDDKRRYILSVLATVLGGGMSSRLFTEIREKRGLAYYVGGMMDKFMETGYMGMRAGTKPESFEEVMKLTKNEFEKLKTKKVADKELKKAKEFLKGRFYLGMEDSEEIADFYGEDLLMSDKIRKVEDLITGIEKVTKEDLMDLASLIFCEERESLAVIGPRGKEGI